MRAVSDGRLWFQVYAWRDRGLVEEMIERAAAARYEALVLTVDTAVLGRRERDVRRGFSLPPTIGPRHDRRRRPPPGLDVVVRAQRADPLRQRRRAATSATAPRRSRCPTTSTPSSTRRSSWDDVDWLRSVWDGPIVLKGIQTVEDAVLAAERGVDAIALSNHGGRQLDGAPAAFSLVAPVADAVGGRIEIICDGGVRRGSDIVKAVAAGATAAMAGRAYLYALGAAGERGVDRVLDWFARRPRPHHEPARRRHRRRPRPHLARPAPRRRDHRSPWHGSLLCRPRGRSMDAEGLLAAASEQTGLSDFGDDSFREGLDRLVHSIATEASLNELGQVALPFLLTRLLTTR